MVYTITIPDVLLPDFSALDSWGLVSLVQGVLVQGFSVPVFYVQVLAFLTSNELGCPGRSPHQS